MAQPSAITLRQIRSIVAVYEERSFTRAAQRENATQSGVSQHVAAAEAALGVTLFEREPNGVHPTPSGIRYYEHAVQVLRQLDLAQSDARAVGGGISGPVDAGLMPTFTRATLAPVLDRFLAAHPEITVRIVEGYSGALTDMVRGESLDFALVPAGPGFAGIDVTHLARDREMLVSGPTAGFAHGEDIRLADAPPLNMIVPSKGNIRRTKLEEYFETHGVRIARMLEMDAMMGTLELVALGDWVSVLPGLICVNDRDGRLRHVSPLADPPLYSDFVMIEPRRKPLSPQARRLFDAMREEIQQLATN